MEKKPNNVAKDSRRTQQRQHGNAAFDAQMGEHVLE